MMQKFDTPQTETGKFGNSKKAADAVCLEEHYEVDFDDKSYNPKSKVECICPKCGLRHVMAFHWIGRGTPRKFCPACKSGSVG